LQHQHFRNARLRFFELGTMSGCDVRHRWHLCARSLLHQCEHCAGLSAKANPLTKRASSSETLGSALTKSRRSPGLWLTAHGQRRIRQSVRETKPARQNRAVFVLSKIELGCALNVSADIAFGSNLVGSTVRRMTSGLPRQADDCRAVGGFALVPILVLSGPSSQATIDDNRSPSSGDAVRSDAKIRHQ
jgi:hypothetical protein